MVAWASSNMAVVLLVDDSQVALRVLGQRLAAAGFDVLKEWTAAAARSVDAKKLACAIFDLELADGEGPGLASELRVASPALPVAFFTAGASASLLERAVRRVPVLFSRKRRSRGLVQWVRNVGCAGGGIAPNESLIPRRRESERFR